MTFQWFDIAEFALGGIFAVMGFVLIRSLRQKPKSRDTYIPAPVVVAPTIPKAPKPVRDLENTIKVAQKELEKIERACETCDQVFSEATYHEHILTTKHGKKIE